MEQQTRDIAPDVQERERLIRHPQDGPSVKIVVCAGTLEQSHARRAEIRKSLAGSDLPLDELDGLTISVDAHKILGGSETRPAAYNPTLDTMRIHPDWTTNQWVLRHEPGHRNSKRRGLDHAQYDNNQRIADEEAYANDFADRYGTRDDRPFSVPETRRMEGGREMRLPRPFGRRGE